MHKKARAAHASAVFFTLCGMTLADWKSRRAETILLDRPVSTTVTGTVERRERDANGNWRYHIALQSTTGTALTHSPRMVMLSARRRGGVQLSLL